MRCSFKTNLKLVIAGLCLLGTSSADAINVSNANTVTEAQMTAALSGTGVTISNLTITNPGNCTNFRRGVGIFTNGTTAAGAGPVLSEPTGVVVANSDFANAANALDTSNNAANTTNTLCNGTTSDADMVTLLAGTSNGEYASIQFDVVPASTTLAIPFQFGSEEFPEYVCSIYTDIVGIFVSGPGITSSTPTFSSPSPGFPYENYAKTSTGVLSSINWLNTGVPGINASNVCTDAAGGGSLSNAAFYTDNSNGSTTGGNGTVATTNANLELDGFTNTLFQPISVVAGQTYHVKIAVADSQDRTYDSAAFIHPLFSTGTFSGFDYGDAPDSYGTLTSNAGPSHGIDSSIFMGTIPDNEITGIPSVGADGDDLNNSDDEDGIASFPVLLSNATSYSVNVNVTNNSGTTARLVGWIDFNGNGTFESTEAAQTLVATGTTGATVALNWSGLSGLVTADTYARFRFSSDTSLSVSTTGSAMSDGEVEDYTLPILGVTFTKYVSTDPVCADTLQSLNAYVGTNVYYCYTVTNPNASAFTVTASTDDQGHDISALQVAYAPAASNTVIIGPLVAGGAELPTSVTTVNNASVTANIGGSSVIVNDSASVTVTAIPPASGIKQLYFDAVNTGSPDLTRDPTDAITDTQTGNLDGQSAGVLTLNQGIKFTAPFTISGGTNADVQMIILRTSNNTTSVQVELFKGLSATSIGVATTDITHARNTWATISIPVAIPADVNFAANDFIRLVITNTSSNTNRRINIRTVNGADKSQLRIESSTVINVDNIVVYANPWPDTTQYSSYTPGSTVSIRATASDPFGSADITSATITIDDPNSPPSLISNAAMTSVATPTGSTRLFQYAYSIPANPEGFWPLSVTANEGFEATVSHTALSTMIVGTPNITISKNSAVLSDPINASNPKAIPGAIIEYSINVENSGFGYVDLDSTLLTDPVPAGTTFYFGSPLNPATFIDGATASGLSFTFIDLSSTVDDIDFSNDGGSTFITPTVDASGFDTTSPPINFIRLIPKGEFNGSDSVNNPSMQIDFRVKVD